VVRLSFVVLCYCHTAPPCRPAQSRVFPLHLSLCRRPPSRCVPTDHAADHVAVCLVLAAQLALAPLWFRQRRFNAHPDSSRATPRRWRTQPRHRAAIRSRDGPRTHKKAHPRIYRTHIWPRVRGLDHARRRGQHGRVRAPFSVTIDLARVRVAESYNQWVVCRWSRIAKLLLNPGDTLLVGEWTYPSALLTGRPLEIRWKAVPMDSQGMRPDSLRAILIGWDVERDGPRCVRAWNLPFGPTMKSGNLYQLDRG